MEAPTEQDRWRRQHLKSVQTGETVPTIQAGVEDQEFFAYMHETIRRMSPEEKRQFTEGLRIFQEHFEASGDDLNKDFDRSFPGTSKLLEQYGVAAGIAAIITSLVIPPAGLVVGMHVGGHMGKDGALWEAARQRIQILRRAVALEV